MKNLNWLVKFIFYLHKEKTATTAKIKDKNAIFYRVGFADQVHGNLCQDACKNMLYHFAGKPIASMEKNPRGMWEAGLVCPSDFKRMAIEIDDIRVNLEQGPFILNMPIRFELVHFCLVLGFANNSFIYHDPLTGSNKMMSLDELKRIKGSNQINIAQPNFLNQPLTKFKELDETPKNIYPKRYKGFFTIDKMDSEEARCKAIKDFLEDYAKDSFWTNRKHIEVVRQFLSSNKKVNNLELLLSNLYNQLPGKALETKGELYKRLKAVEKMFNAPIIAFKKNVTSTYNYGSTWLSH